MQCTGTRTEIALDGRQALAVASRWRPDVCVLDLQMPKLNGCEVASQIRAQTWNQRPLLVALTGWTTQHDRVSALEAGFDYYVTKPVEPSWLVRLIQSWRVEAVTQQSVRDEGPGTAAGRLSNWDEALRARP